jgi:hypothetical protein
VRPPRTDGKTCTVPNCQRPYYALDLCRSHYNRAQLYGDPTHQARRGGPKYTPSILEEAGIPPHTLRRWVREGHLNVPLHSTGNKRIWNPREVRIALLLQRLTDAGLPTATAAKVARSVVLTGRTAVDIGEGVSVAVAENPEHRRASAF